MLEELAWIIGSFWVPFDFIVDLDWGVVVSYRFIALVPGKCDFASDATSTLELDMPIQDDVTLCFWMCWSGSEMGPLRT